MFYKKIGKNNTKYEKFYGYLNMVNKMVKIWDKMFDTEDEEASESEQSDDECVDARQYREGDAALDRVLELLNWG